MHVWNRSRSLSESRLQDSLNDMQGPCHSASSFSRSVPLLIGTESSSFTLSRAEGSFVSCATHVKPCMQSAPNTYARGHIQARAPTSVHAILAQTTTHRRASCAGVVTRLRCYVPFPMPLAPCCACPDSTEKIMLSSAPSIPTPRRGPH
eukprot:6184330-Pleurochrysis_carterae.AAC.2